MLGSSSKATDWQLMKAKALVTGVSACTYKPWDDFDPDDEDSWDEF